MAAVGSFETLVPTYQTVQCHFPVDCYIDTAGRPQDVMLRFNPLNAELNPICYLLALLGAHHFLHVSRIRVNLNYERFPEIY